MDIVCQKCQSKFRIADNKISSIRNASIPCPKCSTRITLPARSNSLVDKPTFEDLYYSSGYDPDDKPFDFIEEEGLTALVCEQNPLVRKTISEALELMEYQTTMAESARDALKRMRYHNYDLIVVNENFDTDNPESNSVLIYLERLGMSIRRDIFVALISGRYRTMDNMMAFQNSVNLIINTKNIDDIGKILSRGISDNEIFFRVFKEKLKELKRV